MLRILKKLWPKIGHFGRHDLISVQILPNFELIRAISEMDVWYKFWNDTLKNVKKLIRTIGEIDIW